MTMKNNFDHQDLNTFKEWQEKINIANNNNIFCHCKKCGKEWVDSSLTALCSNCGSREVEHISCWQFPDD